MTKQLQRYPVYVQTPKGNRYHGYIVGKVFVREIDRKYVRWSDGAFTLNTSAMLHPRFEFVNRIVFMFNGKVYHMNIKNLKEVKPTVNEEGEENYRLPIDKFHITELKK